MKKPFRNIINPIILMNIIILYYIRTLFSFKKKITESVN